MTVEEEVVQVKEPYCLYFYDNFIELKASPLDWAEREQDEAV